MPEIVERPKPARAIAQDIARHFIRNESSVLALILASVMAGLGGMTRGATLTISNISNIWLQSATRGIASIGQLFVLLTSGIDLSVGGLALLVTVVGAFLASGQTSLPVEVIALMLLIGVGIGAVNGALVSRVPMPALIVTLGMWQITRGCAFEVCKGVTYRHLPDALAFFGQGYIAGVSVPVIIFVSVAVVAYFVLNYTTFGRSIYAVGGNPMSAWLSGVNVRNVRFSVYIISGFLAALAGFITMSRVMSGGMNTVAGLELDSIAAVCIGGVSLMGGRGTLLGAMIGVMILSVINNGMNVLVVDPAAQDIAKGAIIVGAVAVDYWRRR